MSLSKGICTAVGALVISSSAALAWEGAGRAYPYAGVANYCPAGLQPVVVGGVICCGTPTTTTTYQAMKRHPVVRRMTTKKHVKSHKHVVTHTHTKYKTHAHSNW